MSVDAGIDRNKKRMADAIRRESIFEMALQFVLLDFDEIFRNAYASRQIPLERRR